MGWGDCGTDSKGRPIGYVFEATCDHEGCDEKIHRGLAYACGDMHGEQDSGCEKYFCEKHRSNLVNQSVTANGEDLVRVCDECAKSILENEDWEMDEEEGIIKYKEHESSST